MNYNFQALFTHLNPTGDQLKAMLQDLWRKIDEYETIIDKIRRENEESLSKNKILSTQNAQQCLKIDDLTNEIEVLKMLVAGDTLSCPVCLEKFDTEHHQAYALSCPHMICSKCLYPAMNTFDPPLLITENNGSTRRATETELRNNGPIIHDQNHPSKRCPVCRQPVKTHLKKICLRS